jgi:hypothetical protein
MPAFVAFCRSLRNSLAAAPAPAQRGEIVSSARGELRDSQKLTLNFDELVSRFSRSVILDMAAQGWELETPAEVRLLAPKVNLDSPEQAKEQIRHWHLLERDAQLLEKAVTEFIQRAEQPRLCRNAWYSIFSLMRDGSELAKKLSEVSRVSDENERGKALSAVVSPYLQFVEPEAVCSHTGLKLTDIWRYFRHTWVNPYKSLPGRSVMVLIRDSAAPNHPVIGIGALGSSMAQQTQRDQWIGWDSDTFLSSLVQKPSRKFHRWLCSSLGRLIGAIYSKDLLREGIISRTELQNPTEAIIQKLFKESRKAAAQHHRFPHAAHHKSSTNQESGQTSWKKQALTSLFRSKRAKTLATLLSIRMAFQAGGLLGRRKVGITKIREALTHADVKAGVRQIVRSVKAEHVGVNMMDIIVCGAVAPYNALLGGKLICSLLCSPEVVEFYEKKYHSQESIIASSMRGRAVVRKPKLVLLATTSLYGVGSSQYNRIKIPLDQLGGAAGEFLEYTNLGVSKGFGSYHFSKLTLSLLEPLLARSRNGKRVNSIFGEGVNPLMRKIRDGLAVAGLPSDQLLKHGNVRVVYGIPLARNFREILLGIEARPKYLIPKGKASEGTHALASFWHKRWLARRIMNADVLDDVAKQTLGFPVTHGARVPLPRTEQGELFNRVRSENS